MKSIKPGRGPSMMNGAGAVFAALFGIVWTCIAAAMFPPMAFFGIFFIGYAVVIAIYNFKNATSENRYSTFDIVDGTEESDPLNERFGHRAGAVTDKTDEHGEDGEQKKTGKFCPYCGMGAEPDFLYCNHCGKKLP